MRVLICLILLPFYFVGAVAGFVGVALHFGFIDGYHWFRGGLIDEHSHEVLKEIENYIPENSNET